MATERQNPHSLLMEMRSGTATLEVSIENPQKVKTSYHMTQLCHSSACITGSDNGSQTCLCWISMIPYYILNAILVCQISVAAIPHQGNLFKVNGKPQLDAMQMHEVPRQCKSCKRGTGKIVRARTLGSLL